MILIAVIIIAAVGIGTVFLLLSGGEQSSETIKIGILADLGTSRGESALQGAILAAEQLNAEGGIMGMKVEVIGEDHNIESGPGPDMSEVSSALTRLITYHNADFIIGQTPGGVGIVCQDIIAEHKKVFFGFGGVSDVWTQRVMDEYDRFKYYFNLVNNQTMGFKGIPESMLVLRENTGFNKVAYLGEDLYMQGPLMEALEFALTEVYGFEVVYGGSFPLDTIDFSSYFAAVEAAGAEILLPFIGTDSGIAFIKEYHDRQSPMVIYSGVISVAQSPECWEWTDEKCEYISVSSYPVVVGYPFTSKTLLTRDAYITRWNENPSSSAVTVYDAIRFVLPDAIERAGTTDANAVIEALEKTSIETSSDRNFAFTSSHDIMFGENINDPEGDYRVIIVFQWQDAKQVPVFPQKIWKKQGYPILFLIGLDPGMKFHKNL